MLLLGLAGIGTYAQDPQPLLHPQPAWSGVLTSSSSSSSSSRLRLASTQRSSPGNNPLLAPNWQLKLGQLPLWDNINPENIQPAVATLIEEETASLYFLEQDLLAGTGAVSFDRIFKPLTQIQLRTDFVSGQFSHLSDVISTDALRAAVEAVTPALVSFRLRLGQSKPIYNALNTLKSSTDVWQQLSPEQQRLVSKTLTEMAGNGVGLEADKKAAFNEIKNKLEQLQNQFSNNVLDAKGAFKLLIEDQADLAGLAATTLALAAQNALADGHTTATAAAGPWLLKLDGNTYSAVMSSAHNRELRHRMYIAEKTAASAGQYDNSGLVRDILKLRQQLAGLLGYNSWGEYRATSKMASIDQAVDLMQQMVSASQPAAAREHEQLAAFARQHSGDPQLRLQWWDVEYYSERQKEALFNLNQQELQQYLPLDSVLKGLFDLAQKAYGISIVKAVHDGDNTPHVWHKDVTLYQVHNQGTQQPIAYFWTDLYARPGSKSGGAWENGIVSGAKLWLTPSPAALRARQLPGGSSNPGFYTPELAAAQAEWLDAAPQLLPAAIVVCNQSPPVAGGPSLMNLREVETLFHEFGHASQDMLTTVKLGLAAGIRNIELDAVEIPSMMQEKWVYDPAIFASIARHWQTQQPLPQPMFDQIAGLQTYRSGTMFALQLSKALTDLKLHSSYDVQAAQSSPGDVYLDTLAQIAPMAPWPGDKFLNQFRHLFYYGYDAGYYSYYWADIISADIHAAFAEAGLDDATAMAEVGRRYRDTFLSLGGSVHPQEVFRRFMGREPSISAWLRYNGLQQ
uniref:oligopeptidase A n=1 Tax=Tetradesmus obliquus TaxID=3088 RepID=A0A383WQC2_TETOB|eukprot:jgi/Sobl393_1/6403/SZX79504.1